MPSVENTVAKKPITLIGMMGSGKSHIGALLAAALKLDLIDSDKVIEQKAGCSIPEIFERDGEAKFRAVEATTVQELLRNGPCVLSTGGGAITNPQTLGAILENSTCVWLYSSIENTMTRIAKNQNRPLLKNDNPQKVLEDLMQARRALYEQAHIRVENKEGQAHQTLQDILKQL